MTQVPDAPWIRDTELYGEPESKTPECPCCGRACETIYTDNNYDVVGCDICMHVLDAFEWMWDQEGDGE